LAPTEGGDTGLVCQCEVSVPAQTLAPVVAVLAAPLQARKKLLASRFSPAP